MWAVINAPFPIVAIVILARLPRNRIGWILIAVGLLTAPPLGPYGSFALAHGLPAGALAVVLSGPLWAPPIVVMGTFLLLRFPTGNLLSPAWRKVEWLSLLAIAVPLVILWLTPGDLARVGHPEVRNPIGIEALRSALDAALVLLVLIPVAIAASAASLVVRFRRSSGVERQQLKWLTATASLVAGWYLLSMVGGVVTGSMWTGAPPAWLDFVQSVFSLSVVLIPVSIGIAVLRYRLYEIDRIISRTVGYAIVTAVLGGLFAGLVIGLRTLAAPLIGSSELAVALSTLAVVALFGPLRRRVQDLVDRRFDRARYDGIRVAENFGARLRDRLDLDDVSGELVSTAHAALRPASASLWLRRPRP